MASPGGAAIRAFVAVPVASRDLLVRLGDVRRPLPRVSGVKWIPTHQLHFTLKFLGDVAPERLLAAQGAVSEAAAGVHPFEVVLEGLGTFPPRGDPRIVWAGCGAGRAALEALASRVEERFAAAGFAPEARRFAAHLTLARVKDPAAGRSLVPSLAGQAPEAFGILAVRELVLYRSDLQPSGPTYTPLLSIPLGAGPS